MKEIVPEQTKQARKEVQASKEEGAAGRRHQELTPASCTACRLPRAWLEPGVQTRGVETRRGGGEVPGLNVSLGKGEERTFP